MRLERPAEMAPQQRQHPLAERPRTADEVLPQPALGLVHAEPGRLRERRAVVARVHLRLVEPVPELVQAASRTAIARSSSLPARRQPHVGVGHAAREGMDGRVQAPVLGVVADRREQLLREPLLRRSHREVPREDAPVLAGRRGGADERDELVLEPREQRAQLGGRQPGLVVVEQDVVRVRELARRRRSTRCSGSGARARAPARARKTLKSLASRAAIQACCACAAALEISAARSVGTLTALCWSRRSARMQRRVVGVRVGRCRPRLERVEQLAESRVGDAVVEDPLERLELIGARVGAAGRHHRVLVPQQQAADAVEVGDLPRAAPQLAELGGFALTGRPARRRRRAARPGSASAKCSAR